jgi:hypothetical protein
MFRILLFHNNLCFFVIGSLLQVRYNDLILSHVKCKVPRISIWSSSLVSEIEILDRVCKDKGIFGSLPICFVTFLVPPNFVCVIADVCYFDEFLCICTTFSFHT